LIGIQDFVYIILSVICAETVINVFSDPKTNGSELIIIAKPIKRIKLICAKFLVVLSVGTIIILISMIFILISGNSDQNISGILGRYLLGTFIISLLFSSIAMIMNCFSGKIGILCTTVGLAVLLSIMHMTIPLTVTNQTDYLKEQFGLDFKVRPFMTRSQDGKVKMQKTVGLNVYSETNQTLELLEKTNQKVNNFAETYLDVGGQMTKMFFAEQDPQTSFN
jgi:ABC-2 type transport system permease protein